jgi:hypothetical protein
MGILRSVLEANGWWTWAPDTSAVAEQKPCATVASRSADRRLLAVYFPRPCTVRVDIARLAGRAQATWVDPRTGAQRAAGLAPPDGVFTLPGGFEDGLLLLTAGAPPSFSRPERWSFPLAVSNDRRHFVDQAGRPFLWVGETNWPLPAYSPEEADAYLTERQRQGFTVIQTVAIFPPDEATRRPVASFRGDQPLLNDNPATPNEYFFQHLDRIIQLAESRGLVVALLPAWGIYVTKYDLIDAENARAYGRYVGRRYSRARNVVWVLGGDTSIWGFFRQSNTWKLIVKDLFCHAGVTDSICTLLRGGH